MASGISLSVRDENFSSGIINEIFINFPSEIVTIKDIIDARVRQEVETYNSRLSGYYHGLVEPTDAEKTVNGFKMRDNKKIDAEKQVYIALDAFQKNGFFVLIDNLQSTTLEQVVELKSTTTISFIKLTQLVGG